MDPNKMHSKQIGITTGFKSHLQARYLGVVSFAVGQLQFWMAMLCAHHYMIGEKRIVSAVETVLYLLPQISGHHIGDLMCRPFILPEVCGLPFLKYIS